MTVEHVDLGSGPPVLFVHGSPGGCDQGELMTRFLAGRHRVVALSRPGYRGTPLTDDTRTPEAHDRVASVVAIAAVSTSYEVGLKRRIGMAEEKLLRNRFGSWLAGRLTDSAPRTAVRMLLAEEGDLSRQDVEELTAQVLDDGEQRAFALALFDTVTGPRRDGFTNDIEQYADLVLPLGDVTSPVLLVHAAADADVDHAHSVHAHERLPDSTFVSGTHVSAWVGPDSARVQVAVRDHLA